CRDLVGDGPHRSPHPQERRGGATCAGRCLPGDGDVNRLTVLLALSSGVTVGAASWALLRPPRRLSGRVRPYAHVARARLLRSADPDTYLAVTRTPATLRAAFTPLVERLSRLHARVLGPRDEELLA